MFSLVAMGMARFLGIMLLALLATLFIFESQVMAEDTKYNLNDFGPGCLKSSQCPKQCSRRCSQTQYHKPCMFLCHKCCTKCLCVPPGFYGNKAVCPCYNNWKTKEGGPKCP